jgi:hypothetical protein
MLHSIHLLMFPFHRWPILANRIFVCQISNRTGVIAQAVIHERLAILNHCPAASRTIARGLSRIGCPPLIGC